MISPSDKADAVAILSTQSDDDLISLLERCQVFHAKKLVVDIPFFIDDHYLAVRNHELGPILEDLLTIRSFINQHDVSSAPDDWDETTKTLFAIQHPEVTL
ncbi:hypothetical protein [uncultured Sphingomonas sp.]|uniref:hypothetical protein n=1 Tax=uncultured Sphingomonas sp. TaxID=158754 RepID=UPI0025F6FD41|nr:hypothetical protein [uncultured Sphingomonas sp.]